MVGTGDAVRRRSLNAASKAGDEPLSNLNSKSSLVWSFVALNGATAAAANILPTEPTMTRVSRSTARFRVRKLAALDYGHAHPAYDDCVELEFLPDAFEDCRQRPGCHCPDCGDGRALRIGAAEIAVPPGCSGGAGNVTTSRLIGSAFRCGPTFSEAIGIASSES